MSWISKKTFYDSIFKRNFLLLPNYPVGAVLPEFEMKKINGDVYRFSDFKKESKYCDVLRPSL